MEAGLKATRDLRLSRSSVMDSEQGRKMQITAKFDFGHDAFIYAHTFGRWEDDPMNRVSLAENEPHRGKR